MCCCCCRLCCGAPTTDERKHVPVLHDESQIAYCRYWGRASLPPINSIIIRLQCDFNPPGVAIQSRKVTRVEITTRPLIIMRRASEASLFFLGFPREKKPLHNGNGSYEQRVPKIKNKTLFCMYVCVIQHRDWPLRSTILNAHGTNASPDGLCTRTYTCLLYTSPSPRD